MASLTDLKARNSKPGDKSLPHGAIPGLVLIPTSRKGHGKWVLRYVSPVTAKRRNAGLGTYPEVGISEAAKKAFALRELISQGSDPLVTKEKEKDASPIPTFSDAAQTLHADLLPSWRNEKHGNQWLNTLTQFAFPVIGCLPLNEIQPSHIAEVLRPIWLSRAETAGRVKQRIRAVMAWGWAHGFCTSNPADVVHHLLPQQADKTLRVQHHPAMSWKDIPDFISAHLVTAQRYDTTRGMLEFLILTASRSGEVRGMTWNEVDLENGVWTIPAERMKAKVRHRVPLTQRAMQILNRQQGLSERFVFPSPRKGTETSDMVLTSFLRKHNIQSDAPGRIATAHGFRSSFRDWCSENGYARDLAERALAHTVANKVESAYHRTDLLDQRRPMMDAWAKFCTDASSLKG